VEGDTAVSVLTTTSYKIMSQALKKKKQHPKPKKNTLTKKHPQNNPTGQNHTTEHSSA